MSFSSIIGFEIREPEERQDFGGQGKRDVTQKSPTAASHKLAQQLQLQPLEAILMIVKLENMIFHQMSGLKKKRYTSGGSAPITSAMSSVLKIDEPLHTRSIVAEAPFIVNLVLLCLRSEAFDTAQLKVTTECHRVAGTASRHRRIDPKAGLAKPMKASLREERMNALLVQLPRVPALLGQVLHLHPTISSELIVVKERETIAIPCARHDGIDFELFSVIKNGFVFLKAEAVAVQFSTTHDHRLHKTFVLAPEL